MRPVAATDRPPSSRPADHRLGLRGLASCVAVPLAWLAGEELAAWAGDLPPATWPEAWAALTGYAVVGGIYGAIVVGQRPRAVVLEVVVLAGYTGLGRLVARTAHNDVATALTLLYVGTGALGFHHALTHRRFAPLDDTAHVAAPLALVLGALMALHLDVVGDPWTAPSAGWTLAMLGLSGAAAFALRAVPLRLQALAVLPVALLAPVRPLPAEAPPPAVPAVPSPDRILVVVDAWRADHFLPPDGAPSPTPALRTLAASGRVWSHAVTPAPWTLPAFAALLTGAPSSVHGAGRHDGTRNTRSALSSTIPTLAGHARTLGHHTAGVVSNPWLSHAWGLSRGFAHWDDRLGVSRRHTLLQPLDAFGLEVLPQRAYRPVDRMIDAADAWWSQHGDRPRLLLLHVMDPHGPWPSLDTPEAPAGTEANHRAAYRMEVEALDQHLAPWLEARIAEGAVVVLTADHGEALAWVDGQPPDHGHGEALSDAIVRVPLVVWGPGVQAGLDDTLVSTREVATTLSQAAGPPVLGDGRNLRGPIPPDRPVTVRDPLFGPWRALALWGGVGLARDGDDTRFLGDPDALTDDVRALLETALPQPSDAPDTPGAPADSPALRRALEALGYTAP